MKLSTQGTELIKYFEGCKLATYICQGGKQTIGYGHTGPDVHVGMTITQAQAADLFTKDIAHFEAGVNSLLKRSATQGQFDAMVAFAFNVGLDIDADTKAEGLGDSSLLRYFNEGNLSAAAMEFPKWDHAKGVENKGLLRRRTAEQAMFRGSGWSGPVL